jgi:hypothetical protein
MARRNMIIDIGFLMGSGRLNWDVELAVMAVMGEDGMAAWGRAARNATDEQVSQMWAICKATPAGAQLK